MFAKCWTAVGMVVFGLCFGMARADYPDKPIHVIVPFGPGGTPDVVTRLIGQRLSERIKQAVVIENRAGAGGGIGTAAGAKAAPDGYTLTIGHVGALTINPAIYKKLPYQPLVDFAPITLAVTTPLILVVNSSSNIKSVAELLAAAKATPGRLTFSSSGNGTASHMAGVLFNSMSGADIVHVPFGSAPAALTGVAGGDVTFTFGGQPPAWPLIKAGKLRVLGLTSARRVAEFPDLPAVAEGGVPGYEVLDWNGFMAPRGTPQEIIERLHREIAPILRTPEFGSRLREQGLEPVGNSPAEFAAWIKRESDKWGRVARSINLTLD